MANPLSDSLRRVALAASSAVALVVVALLLLSVPQTFVQHRLRQQRRTEHSLRTLSIALESYALQHQRLLPLLPELLVASRSEPEANDRSWPPSAWPPPLRAQASALRRALVPEFIRDLPERDSWNNPIQVAISNDLRHYTLVSFGRDGLPDSSHQLTFPPGEADRDIVLADGRFVCFPEGEAQ